MEIKSATFAWLEQCSLILATGEYAIPRNIPILEVRQSTVTIDMSYPLVTCPARKLNYSFAAAEALWILNGDNRVETIAPYNPNIAQFSDDGVIFNGAYGPRIQSQINFVLEKLIEDRDTRQAVLTIWTPKPVKSKDTPCTVAMSFMIRKDKLHCQVFMRSSDIWLGLPYDMFNFTMVAAYVTCQYNNLTRDKRVSLGELSVTAASSHAYIQNCERIIECINDASSHDCNKLPTNFITESHWSWIYDCLISCRDKNESLNPESWIIRPTYSPKEKS